ncbi:MAG: MBL fold metallo-hydrolase [Cytophagales bacterium]|nr:MBL fold metallo-hydrolase [Cytophagales bacterium]
MSIENKPSADEIEISLIGTGGGYGESIVIKMANDDWIIVDSCINPITKVPLPLEYIENLGVDVSKRVKLIICTHWHDDHIQGISEIFKKCSQANFCMAKVTDKNKFLQFVALDSSKIDEASNSSTKEFSKCLKVLEMRKKNIISAFPDRTIYNENFDGTNFKIFTLSPSDLAIQKFDLEISDLITEFGTKNKKVIPQSPNLKSVVLLLEVGNHSMLLGADLEVSTDPKLGWKAILNESQVTGNKSSLFKVSHHGSKNGFHQRIFDELLDQEVACKLTPWNKRNKLPEIQMLQAYHNKSNVLLMTSPVVSSSKPKRTRDRKIEKYIKSLNVKLSEIKFDKGIVRSRIKYGLKNAKWRHELFDSAFEVKIP